MADPDDLADRIVQRARKRARRRSERSTIWFGVGTFGIIGWSVAVPTLLGLALGIWLDRHTSSELSWTLALLLAGITLGCLNAWYWLTAQHVVENGEVDDVD